MAWQRHRRSSTPSLLLSSLSILLLVGSPVFAGFCPVQMRNQSACSCDEYVDGAIVKCNGPKGPVVVESLKKLNVELRELVLENANIIEIGPRAFLGMRIKKLVLDNNKIKLIQKNAFRGLESVLQELSIASNRLTEIPTAALDGLRALNILNLRCNRIGNVTDVALTNMPALIEVHLGCNKICSIADVAFREVKQTVQNIILDNNCIEEVPTGALEDMNALIALHMKYNQIEKLREAQLRNMSNLSLFTLTGNQISSISPNFTQGTPSLRYIYLAENQIAEIEPGAMKQFAAAEIIDLSHNGLREIGTSMFNGMENLQHLNLEANAIKEVAPGAFATTPLLLLWLPHNCISTVSPTMFQGAPFLKQVSLAHNNIRTVQPFSFAHLANLHTLDLSHNKMQSIQPSAIMGSDFLTVRVQENPLVCTQDGFHVMNGREAINLTTEVNLVCKTDYSNDVNDKCPNKPSEVPLKKPCCDGSAQTTTTMTTTTTTTTELASMSPEVTENVEDFSSSRPTAPEDGQSEGEDEATTPEPRGKARARQLNMERFYRLSRRPEAQVQRNNKKQPMLDSARRPLYEIARTANGTLERKELGEAGKAGGGELPAHVKALISGSYVPQQARKRPQSEQKQNTEEDRRQPSASAQSPAGESGDKTPQKVSTTEIHKAAFNAASFIDSPVPSKQGKHPHEHLQENGEFSKDQEPVQVAVEQKKPAQQEVVAKQ